jgi:hypothetical protein
MHHSLIHEGEHGTYAKNIFRQILNHREQMSSPVSEETCPLFPCLVSSASSTFKLCMGEARY